MFYQTECKTCTQIYCFTVFFSLFIQSLQNIESSCSAAFHNLNRCFTLSLDELEFLSLRCGDLLLLNRNPEFQSGHNWTYAKNERTGNSGAVSLDVIHIVPSLSKPTPEIIVSLCAHASVCNWDWPGIFKLGVFSQLTQKIPTLTISLTMLLEESLLLSLCVTAAVSAVRTLLDSTQFQMNEWLRVQRFFLADSFNQK